MCCSGGRDRNGSEAALAEEQRVSVRVLVDNAYGSGEVRSSANVDVNDDGLCGYRYENKGLGMYCGDKSYRTGSEVEAAAEQRRRVLVVVNSVCGGR